MNVSGMGCITTKRAAPIGRTIRAGLAALVAFGLLAAPGRGAPTMLAAPTVQDVPPPPSLGATVLQSALTGPEVFAPGTCPTGAAGGENVDEGFKLSVRGRCVPDAGAANLPVPSRQIAVWDGDVALDFKVVSGVERAGINLHVRIRDSSNLLSAYISLATGRAELFRRDDGVNTIVASTQDLGGLDATGWNRLALRLADDQMWLLLNGAPLLHAAGVISQGGGIGVAVVREGNVDDRDEVAVVFRDLTLTELAGLPGEESEPDSEPAAPAQNPALRP